MMLLRSASARPHPQPGAFASCIIAVVLRMWSSFTIFPTSYTYPLSVCVYWRQAGHWLTDLSKKAAAFSR